MQSRMRLIDADVLYKTIDQEADFYGGFGDNVITASELRRCIEMVPTIDAVPVVHGLWVYGEDDYDDSTYYCSACGEPWTLIAGTPQENNMRYCPFCGAKMDGGTE